VGWRAEQDGKTNYEAGTTYPAMKNQAWCQHAAGDLFFANIPG